MSDIDVNMLNEESFDPNEKHEVLSRKERLFIMLKTRKFWTNFIIKLFTYAVLIDFAFVFLLPFLYMISTSLMTKIDLTDTFVTWLPKRGIFWENLKLAFPAMKYGVNLPYTVRFVLIATIGHLFSGITLGYALGRFKFLGRNLVFILVIFSMILPVQVLTWPLTFQYIQFDLLNQWAILLPTFLGLGLNGGIFVFLYRQTFAGLPKELEEAAMIDGCGIFSTFTRVMIPLTGNVSLVTLILSIVWHWNDYFEPTAYMLNMDMSGGTLLSIRLLTMGTLGHAGVDVKYANGEAYAGIQATMAQTLATLFPLIIFYLLVQKYFMKSVQSTGIKG